MPFLDSVKGSLAGKGKWWVIGGAVAGVGYLWWTRGRSASSAAAGAAQITPGGAAVADPVTPVGGDYSTPATPPVRPASNAEWLSESVSRVIGAPHNVAAGSAWNALNKALSGDALTTAEAAIVELALTLVGTPPEGMPRLNIASPAPAQTTTPAPSSPAPADTYKVKSGDNLGGIASRWGTSSSAAYGRNAGVIEAAAKAHGLSSSRGGPNNSPGWWIFPGTILTKP